MHETVNLHYKRHRILAITVEMCFQVAEMLGSFSALVISVVQRESGDREHESFEPQFLS